MNFYLLSNDLLTWQIVGDVDCNDFSYIDRNNYSVFIVYVSIVLNLSGPIYWPITLVRLLANILVKCCSVYSDPIKDILLHIYRG